MKAINLTVTLLGFFGLYFIYYLHTESHKTENVMRLYEGVIYHCKDGYRYSQDNNEPVFGAYGHLTCKNF